jgi:hypothetical protein
VFCGAPKTVLDRDAGLENYAYGFIHTDNIKQRIDELFGDEMQFKLSHLEYKRLEPILSRFNR